MYEVRDEYGNLLRKARTLVDAKEFATNKFGENVLFDVGSTEICIYENSEWGKDVVGYIIIPLN